MYDRPVVFRRFLVIETVVGNCSGCATVTTVEGDGGRLDVRRRRGRHSSRCNSLGLEGRLGRCVTCLYAGGACVVLLNVGEEVIGGIRREAGDGLVELTLNGTEVHAIVNVSSAAFQRFDIGVGSVYETRLRYGPVCSSKRSGQGCPCRAYVTGGTRCYCGVCAPEGSAPGLVSIIIGTVYSVNLNTLGNISDSDC